jgi:hypothetical protein
MHRRMHSMIVRIRRGMLCLVWGEVLAKSSGSGAADEVGGSSDDSESRGDGGGADRRVACVQRGRSDDACFMRFGDDIRCIAFDEPPKPTLKIAPSNCRSLAPSQRAPTRSLPHSSSQAAAAGGDSFGRRVAAFARSLAIALSLSLSRSDRVDQCW